MIAIQLHNLVKGKCYLGTSWVMEMFLTLVVGHFIKGKTHCIFMHTEKGHILLYVNLYSIKLAL